MTDIKSALRTVGGGYLIYIAWQLLTASSATFAQKAVGGVLGLCGAAVLVYGTIGLWHSYKPSDLDQSDKEQ